MVASEMSMDEAPSLRSARPEDASHNASSFLMGSTIPTNPLYMSQTEHSMDEEVTSPEDLPLSHAPPPPAATQSHAAPVPQFVQADDSSSGSEEDAGDSGDDASESGDEEGPVPLS